MLLTNEFASSQSLCKLWDIGSVDEKPGKVDNGCLKTSESDVIFPLSIIYAMDSSFWLSWVQLKISNNNVESNLTEVRGEYFEGQVKKTVSFLSNESVQTIDYYYTSSSNKFLRSMRLTTSSQRTLDIGTIQMGDEKVTISINGNLSGIYASYTTNFGIGYIKFYTVKSSSGSSCDVSCSDCSSSITNCQACASGYYAKENQSFPTACYNTDPTGFYLDNTSNPKVYRACEAKCAICQGSAGFCLTCSTSYYKTEEEENNCYNAAPEGFRLDESVNPKIYMRKRDMLKMNQLEDITVDEIEPSFSGRYTIEFWFMSSTNSLSSGVHFIWKNLIAVTVIQNTNTNANLDVYCWPRDYLNSNLPNLYGTNIPPYQNTLADNSLVYSLTSYGNNWIFIRCAMNFNNKNFYLNVADNVTNKDILNEKISLNNLNDNPFKYFFQPDEKTQFRILGSYRNSGTNIYIGTLALFTEALPNKMLGYRT